MNFGQAIAAGFCNYANFWGRASQAEFWYWVLFAIIGALASNLVDAAVFTYHSGISPLNSPLSNLFTVVVLLPSLAVATRRLHDVDRTGWWMLLASTGLGLVALLYWHSQDGTPGPNRFGIDPTTARRLEPTRAV